MPKVSVIQAMVEAVPITAQVPAVVASRPSTRLMVFSSISPALYFAQKRRQSVQAPKRSPSNGLVIIGPVISAITGTSALAAPINWAGKVLSQPPMTTAASIGWARIISSTSMLIKLRYIKLVGFKNVSPSEMVGKSIGRPPAASTPRFTASTSSGIWRWQAL